MPWLAWIRQSVQYAVLRMPCPRCKVLFVGKYSNPSLGPFPQVCCSITGVSKLLVHLGCAIFYLSPIFTHVDNLRNIVWICDLMAGTTADVMIWDARGPSRCHGRFFDFEMGAHDGAYKGRIHTVVPYVGCKKLCDDQKGIMDQEEYPPPPPCLSYALVQATVGVGTVLIWYLILIRYQI